MYWPNGLLDYAPIGLQSGQRSLHLLRQSLELVEIGVEYLDLGALFRVSYVAWADHCEIVVDLAFKRVVDVEGARCTWLFVVNSLAEGVLVPTGKTIYGSLALRLMKGRGL